MWKSCNSKWNDFKNTKFVNKIDLQNYRNTQCIAELWFALLESVDPLLHIVKVLECSLSECGSEEFQLSSSQAMMLLDHTPDTYRRSVLLRDRMGGSGTDGNAENIYYLEFKINHLSTIGVTSVSPPSLCF